MSLRVIAGTARGRRLKPVPGDSTRPIMDRVKEALFSILGREIIDARLLDLFGGTGSVGIEALSRGACYVLFTDLDRMAIQTIYENLKITKLGDRAEVRRTDALAMLRQSPAEPFDFVYVAPPQYKGIWLKVMQALDANPTWIHRQLGTVIVQIDPKEYEPNHFENLYLYDKRTYGKTMLLFYSGQEPEGEEGDA
jgi:16S rRNA (guanine966-N2)-methyltransferase